MKKPQELFETELAEIREELLRLGVRPKENPTKPATSVSERQIITPSTLTAAQAAATQKELHDAWQETSCHWLYRMQVGNSSLGKSGVEADNHQVRPRGV